MVYSSLTFLLRVSAAMATLSCRYGVHSVYAAIATLSCRQYVPIACTAPWQHCRIKSKAIHRKKPGGAASRSNDTAIDYRQIYRWIDRSMFSHA